MGAATADRLDQAGCLGVVEDDHVTGAHERREFPGIPRGGLTIASMSPGPSPWPSPGEPCSMLWIRLVTRKNAGSPPITTQRASSPTPRM